jgi:hypothetical protein
MVEHRLAPVAVTANSLSTQPLARTAFQRGLAMIKKVAGGYKVLSEKGKNLGGPYKTKKEAEKRLKQVEYFRYAK